VTDYPARRTLLPAAKTGPRPGDFPVGSPESRAAARLMLSDRERERDRLELIHHVPRPERDGHSNEEPHATPWTETLDGRLMRVLYVPPAMTVDVARRIVDGQGE
jgi:hypothetical protein